MNAFFFRAKIFSILFYFIFSNIILCGINDTPLHISHLFHLFLKKYNNGGIEGKK